MIKASGLAPHVTGISPNKGTPGIKLTIRGENLGTTENDLTHVFINQIDMFPTAKWFSPKKITVITPMGVGALEIVVVTKSGKFGTSSVTYEQPAKSIVGAQISVPYWPPDERKHCSAIYEHVRTTKSSIGSDTDRTGIPLPDTSATTTIPDSTLREVYPSGTGSYELADKDFDPVMYLLKHYMKANFNDLVKVYNNMRRYMDSECLSEPVNVIRSNLVLIFRCLEGMDHLRKDIKSDQALSDPDSNYQSSLELTLLSSRSLGHRLFEGILKRKDHAESTRNAIGVMQRYQFLFNLPHAIRTNIYKGNYRQVLDDYVRAKPDFANSDVEALKRVYNGVLKVINDFHILLRKQITTMPVDSDDAKLKIEYLLKLEVDYDPAWLCLLRFQHWLIEEVQCYRKIYNRSSDSDTSVTAGKTAAKNVPRPSLPSTKWTNDAATDEATSLLDLVKAICQLLITQVVPFWRLGFAFASGQFQHFDHSDRPTDMTSRTVAGGRRGTETDLERPQTPSQPKNAWKQLNLELIHALANALRSELLESDHPDQYSRADILCGSIREFRRCCDQLPLADLPPQVGEVFANLAHDLRRSAVNYVLQYAKISIETLHLKETWTTNISDIEGATTNLTVMYENIMHEALDRCRDLVASRVAMEKPLFELADVQERFPNWFADAMLAFFSTLTRLADQIDSSLSNEEVNGDTENGLSSPGIDSDTVRQYNQTEIISQARGLLLLLNNARWISQQANPRLLNLYKSSGYASVQVLEERLNMEWFTGCTNLASRYVQLRTTWLCAPLQQEIANSTSVAGGAGQAPAGVHNSFRTIVGNLSHIYSELILLLGLRDLIPQNDNDQKTAGIHIGRNCGAQYILVQINTRLVEFLDSFATSSKSRNSLLQSVICFNILKTIIPESLFSKGTVAKLNNLCSPEGANKSFSAQEKELISQLVAEEKPRLCLLSDGFSIFRGRSGPRKVQITRS